MNPYRCYYHPQIEAITKCERCGKYLCLECKQIYQPIAGHRRTMAYYRQELCPECRDKRETYQYLYCVIFLVVFIIFIIFMLQILQNFTKHNDPYFPFS